MRVPRGPSKPVIKPRESRPTAVCKTAPIRSQIRAHRMPRTPGSAAGNDCGDMRGAGLARRFFGARRARTSGRTQIQIGEQVGQRRHRTGGPDRAQVETGHCPSRTSQKRTPLKSIDRIQLGSSATPQPPATQDSTVSVRLASLRHMGVVARLAQGVEDIRIERRQLRLRIHHQAGLCDARQRGLSVRIQLELRARRPPAARATAGVRAHSPPAACIRPMSMPPSCKAWACSALLISRSTTFTPGAWRRSCARGSVSNSAEVTNPTVNWPRCRARSAGALLGGVDAATLTRASSTMASAAAWARRPGASARTARTPRSFPCGPAPGSARAARCPATGGAQLDAAVVHHRQEITQMPGFAYRFGMNKTFSNNRKLYPSFLEFRHTENRRPPQVSATPLETRKAPAIDTHAHVRQGLALADTRAGTRRTTTTRR